MTCKRAMDLFMEKDEERFSSLFDRVPMRLHLLRCPRCGREAQLLEKTIHLMRTEFLPGSPDLADAIMTAVQAEVAAAAAKAADANVEETMSFRNWVVGGFLIFASLAVSPFGVTFDWLVELLGPDLLLPISVTLGVVLTAYCALFIGSHLDELAERFGLSREG
jgi:hypothetical protein